MAPFHVLKKNHLGDFNKNFRGTLQSNRWGDMKPECAPVYAMKIAQREDRESLATFARKNFYRDEPLRSSSIPVTVDEADINFHLDKIPLGSVITAVKPDFNDFIVGAVIAGPKVRWQLERLADRYDTGYSKWGKILRLWAQAEKEADVFERYGVTRIMHAYALAVHRDYRGYGLGSRMLRELSKVGRKLGYEAISIDATSEFASCACQDYKMDHLNTIAYQDYMDHGGYLIFNPPHPHNALRTYAKKIQKLEI